MALPRVCRKIGGSVSEVAVYEKFEFCLEVNGRPFLNKFS